MVKRFISCVGEAYGFAYQACEQALGEFEPLPRLEIERALSELFAQHAAKAVVPAENTSTGYYAESFGYLLNFDAEITGEVWTDIRHCLAVPENQLRELVQSGFPGGAGFRGAEGRQLSEADQRVYRNRIDTVFVPRGSEPQCKRSLQNLNVPHKLLNDDVDAAREVMREARLGLDPNRIMKLSESADGSIETQSTAKASQHKPLYGVVLPLDVARRSDEYVIIQDRMDDDPENSTRFYVVEQRRKDQGDDNAPRGRPAEIVRKRIKEILEKPEFVAARMIVKLDTRGDAKTPDVGDITKTLRTHNIPFTPIYLHNRPHELPVVLEIEWTEERANKAAARVVLDAIFDPKQHRNPKLLGLYGIDSATPVLAPYAGPAKAGAGAPEWAKFGLVGAGALAAGLVAERLFGVLGRLF